MENLIQDLRYALRQLLRSPGFTLVAVLTLALGIGANTGIFSVVNALLLRPLPFAQPERLVRVYETGKMAGNTFTGSVSAPNLRDWRAQSTAFSGLAAYTVASLNLQGNGEPERLRGVEANANLFRVLGVQPRLGRGFAEGEDESGARVAVLSDGFWRRRFGADPRAVGRTLTLDGEAYTVIGVMPEEFRFPARGSATDVWVPLTLSPAQAETRGSHMLTVVGRLKPGVTEAAAQQQMSAIASRLAQEYPGEQENRGIRLVPLRQDVVGRVRPALMILLGAAGLVLLIACANVANLLLVRATSRRREVAVRAALGADRGRLVRQFLAESLLLAISGAALGLLFAHAATDAILALAAGSLPRADAISFNPTVLGFSLLLAIGTAIVFGLFPALRATRVDLHEDLKAGGRGSSARAGQRLRAALVVGQLALAVILLSGAGLLLRTLYLLQQTELGLNPRSVLTLHVSVPPDHYPAGLVNGFARPMLERVRALPGVRDAGIISALPLQDWGINGNFGIEGRPPDPPGQEPFAELRITSPGYFAALGIPVVRGRDFTAQDDGHGQLAVVINQTLARKYFPGENPIGRRLQLGDNTFLSIVGVVGDIRESALDRAPSPQAYFPAAELDAMGWGGFLGSTVSIVLVARTGVPPMSALAAIRGAIHSVDPAQPVYGVETMQQVVTESISDRRLYLWLLGSFAAIALLLAAAGIYGVMSYMVSQRTREMGIRMALGAEARRVRALVLRQGMVLAGTGTALGVLGAFALTRFLASLLYGVSARDPLIFVAVPSLLIGVALLSVLVPARRATRVEPTEALRTE